MKPFEAKLIHFILHKKRLRHNCKIYVIVNGITFFTLINQNSEVSFLDWLKRVVKRKQNNCRLLLATN